MNQQEAEGNRYDRQVRLWGSGTQRRLQSTRIEIIGVNPIHVELAKTLILAGVQSVCIRDPTNRVCSSRDFETCHFVYQRDVDGARRLEEAVVERLAELNPHVQVTGAGGASSLMSSYRVILVRSMSEATMLASAMDASALTPSSDATVTLLLTCWGSCALGIFLSHNGASAKAVKDLLEAPSVSTAPRPLQLCALRLHAAPSQPDEPFVETLHRALTAQEQLQLSSTDDDDIQALLDVVCCGDDASRDVGDIEGSLGTVAGSVLAQQIIARVGSLEQAAQSSQQQQPVFPWMAISVPRDGSTEDYACFV